jgi:hypothetical protein
MNRITTKGGTEIYAASQTWTCPFPAAARPEPGMAR